MSKIAIDVVLLPPEDIMDKAIEINSQFADDPIKLNKENCLPHISLCMGVVKEKNLLKIKEIIDGISKQFSKLFLTIDEISDEHVCFEIKNNENLQKLHEEIMTKLSSYLSYDATTDMCFSPPPVVEKTLTWINNYKKTSFENFYPHITLGISKLEISKLENRKLNIDFIASKLAVCHLGNYCTCRKVIISSDLG
jgi:2'-5' RNA ligase